MILPILLLLLAGCATAPGEAGYWTQCVKVSGYGVSMVTPYGPLNLGVLTYERNVACSEDIKPAAPH